MAVVLVSTEEAVCGEGGKALPMSTTSSMYRSFASRRALCLAAAATRPQSSIQFASAEGVGEGAAAAGRVCACSRDKSGTASRKPLRLSREMRAGRTVPAGRAFGSCRSRSSIGQGLGVEAK